MTPPPVRRRRSRKGATAPAAVSPAEAFTPDVSPAEAAEAGEPDAAAIEALQAAAERAAARTAAVRLVEALLFASPAPLDRKALADRLPAGTDIEGILDDLERHYAGRGVVLVRAGGTWAFRTAPDLAPALRTETTVERRLSRAAVETLAIIAYHQPVTRADIEQIRGVALSKGTLDVLLEAGWIRPRGRRRTPGRPMTWGTSDAFLDHFALSSLDDLPGVDDLRAAGLLDPRPTVTSYGASRETDDGSGDDEDEAIDSGEDSGHP